MMTERESEDVIFQVLGSSLNLVHLQAIASIWAEKVVFPLITKKNTGAGHLLTPFLLRADLWSRWDLRM